MTGTEFAGRRHALGLSQRALAARLGYDHGALARWELRGDDNVPTYAETSLEMLERLIEIEQSSAVPVQRRR